MYSYIPQQTLKSSQTCVETLAIPVYLMSTVYVEVE